VLAPLAEGIGEIDGEFRSHDSALGWAKKVRIGAGSLVIVDNTNGKFTTTPG
jgi:hypothetical protein